MKGLDLAEAYFTEYGPPLLEKFGGKSFSHTIPNRYGVKKSLEKLESRLEA